MGGLQIEARASLENALASKHCRSSVLAVAVSLVGLLTLGCGGTLNEQTSSLPTPNPQSTTQEMVSTDTSTLKGTPVWVKVKKRWSTAYHVAFDDTEALFDLDSYEGLPHDAVFDAGIYYFPKGPFAARIDSRMSKETFNQLQAQQPRVARSIVVDTLETLNRIKPILEKSKNAIAISIETMGSEKQFASALEGLKVSSLMLGGATDSHVRILLTLPDLKYLSMDTSLLTQKSSQYFGALNNLRRLELSGGAGLGHVLAGLGPNSELERLHVLNWKFEEGRFKKEAQTLSSTDLAHLTRLKQLGNLSIGGIALDRASCAIIGELSSLRILEVFYTELSDELFEQVATLSKLEGLVLVGESWTMDKASKLSKLVNLKAIEVGGPGFTDEMLAPIANMADLRSLHISYSKISGNGLKSVNTLNKLKKLSITNSGIEDASLRHIASMSSLKSVELTETPITDRGVPHLSSLANLEYLDLTETKTTNSALSHLKGLSKLKFLKVEGSPILKNATPEEILALPWMHSMRTLDVSKMNISSDVLRALGQLSQLRRLNLKGNPITDDGLMHLSGLSKLKSLNLSETNISDEGLSHLRHLRSLTTLSIEDTATTHAGMRRLRENAELTELTLGFRGSQQYLKTDESIVAVSSHKWFKQLEKLNLSDAYITPKGLSKVATIRGLKALNLSDTKLISGGLKHLANLTQLESLDLQGSGISANELSELKGLSALKELNLARGFSLASEETPPPFPLSGLAVVTSLVDLDLSRRTITITDAKSLSALTNLQALNLDHCTVEAGALLSLVTLKNLQSLKLSNAKLSAADLDVLGKLPNLKQLDLDSAEIDGDTLEALASLQSIESLDLNNLKFKGEVARHLANLTYLKKLNLRNLKLVDADMEHLKTLTTLTELNLGLDTYLNKNGGALTDEGVKQLVTLAQLESIDLDGQPITNESFATFALFTKLGQLSVSNTKVTKDKTEAFKAQMPRRIWIHGP